MNPNPVYFVYNEAECNHYCNTNQDFYSVLNDNSRMRVRYVQEKCSGKIDMSEGCQKKQLQNQNPLSRFLHTFLYRILLLRIKVLT